MQVGDLVRLAKWCKNGPALMQIIEIEPLGSWGMVNALFLQGPEIGSIAKVTKGNIFSIEEYEGAMKKHYDRR
jgi:hypothetical protein